MLNLPPSVRIFFATQAIDGRKGADSLAGMIRSVFLADPLNGHLYVFFSKRRDRVRIVYWDENGFAMWSKRLELGKFRASFSSDGRLALRGVERADLALILDGIDLANARRRPRWSPQPTNTTEPENRPI